MIIDVWLNLVSTFEIVCQLLKYVENTIECHVTTLDQMAGNTVAKNPKRKHPRGATPANPIIAVALSSKNLRLQISSTAMGM